MYCKRVEVKNFRNIKEARVEFSEGVNVLVGENAQGKTNLLEGIFLLSVGKSFRATNSNEMISFGERSAEISLDYKCDGRIRDDNINIKLFSDKKKVEEAITQEASRFFEELCSRYGDVFGFGEDKTVVIKCRLKEEKR